MIWIWSVSRNIKGVAAAGDPNMGVLLDHRGSDFISGQPTGGLILGLLVGGGDTWKWGPG